jgi:hypothetical protein
MPLPVYTTHPPDKNYRAADNLYDEAMGLEHSNKAAAIQKLEQAKVLLESCNEENAIFMVEHELKRLRGW